MYMSHCLYACYVHCRRAKTCKHTLTVQTNGFEKRQYDLQEQLDIKCNIQCKWIKEKILVITVNVCLHLQFYTCLQHHKYMDYATIGLGECMCIQIQMLTLFINHDCTEYIKLKSIKKLNIYIYIYVRNLITLITITTYNYNTTSKDSLRYSVHDTFMSKLKNF